MAACFNCSGTGESHGNYMGLDCTYEGCTAASERAGLEAAHKAAGPMTEYDQRWFAYGKGKVAALEQDEEDLEYELVQDDMVVAGATGHGAKKEIQHYAMVYGQDGPCTIYQVIRHKVEL